MKLPQLARRRFCNTPMVQGTVLSLWEVVYNDGSKTLVMAESQDDAFARVTARQWFLEHRPGCEFHCGGMIAGNRLRPEVVAFKSDEEVFVSDTAVQLFHLLHAQEGKASCTTTLNGKG